MSGGLLRPGAPGRGPKGAGIFQRPETLPSLLLVFVCGLFCFAVALYGQSQTHSAALPASAPPTATQAPATPVSTPPQATASSTAIAIHGGSLADSPPDYGVAALAYRTTAPILGLEEASLRGGPLRPLDLKADSASNAPLIPTATASPSPRPTATPSATATPTTIPTATPIPLATATPIPLATATPIAVGGRTEQVWITGYTLGGTTATGTQAGPGVCAVDPSYIALGTAITIDGVGTCQAQDTGSAVIGAHIDVWVPSDDVAYSITGWHTAHW